MIKNSNGIGTILSGLIQEVKPKVINPIQFLQNNNLDKGDIRPHWFVHSTLK